MTVRPELQVRAERAAAARRLLRHPWVTREADPEAFAIVALHRAWLVDRFDQFCGWPLHIDLASGTARLHKRPAAVDPHRPLRRADGRAFDRRRHALLATVCAELLGRPLQTIADLADAVEDLHADPALIDFDTGSRAHRYALVDVLHWLMALQILADPIGDLAGYATDRDDVVLQADQTRIAMLLSTPQPPGHMPTGTAGTPESVVTWLTTEPRYGEWGDPTTRPTAIPSEESRPQADARNLYARHMLARRLLDDPAVELDDVDVAVERYARSQHGRVRTAEIADFLDFVVEHHEDVLLMVDEAGESTDSAPFDRPAAHVAQAGAVVLDGIMSGTTTTVADARRTVADLLATDSGWATGRQGQADAFAEEVLTSLQADWLIHRTPAQGDDRTDDPAHDRLHPRAGANRLRITIEDRRDVDLQRTTPARDPVTRADAEPLALHLEIDDR